MKPTAGTTFLSTKSQPLLCPPDAAGEEFQAHFGPVSCPALVKSSGRLLATGGEDCRMNIWAVSKANCITSLMGHNNPVECVQFNVSEDQVVTRSQSAKTRTPPSVSEPFPAPPEDDTVLPIGHQLKNMTSFPDKQQSSPNSSGGALSDEDALAQIMKGHHTMSVMLSSRQKKLQTVQAVWAQENVKSGLDAAVSMNDLAVVVDILNNINQQPSLWKLDLCTTILPQINKLLQSKYESYIQTGFMSLKLIMKHFWMLISDTLKATPSIGVNITQDERDKKCKECYKQLKNLSNTVKNRAAEDGRHGSTFKQLQLLMVPLDDSL